MEKKRMLVAYFSASGWTRKAARALAVCTGAEVFEIVPQQPYTPADLDWRDPESRSSVEMRDERCRPAIARRLTQMEQYDVVFLGFPVWWYTAPQIILSFIESYSFMGKTVVPFATSGGTAIDGACNDLRRLYPKIIWKPGKLITPVKQTEMINAWLRELGLL